jgi:hypothetical protein
MDLGELRNAFGPIQAGQKIVHVRIAAARAGRCCCTGNCHTTTIIILAIPQQPFLPGTYFSEQVTRYRSSVWEMFLFERSKDLELLIFINMINLGVESVRVEMVAMRAKTKP